MTGPHVAQDQRDLLDDHNVTDHEMAGDDETAPEPQVRQHLAGTVRPTTQHIEESR